MTIRTAQTVMLTVLVLAAGCVTSREPMAETDAAGHEISGVPDFPPGRYVHSVELEIAGHGSHQLRGVLKLTDVGMNLVGLSPMGTTVFKIDDKFADEQVGIEIYQSELQPHEDKILGFYRQLRPILAGRRLPGEAYAALVPAGWNVKFYESGRDPQLPPTIAVHSEKFSLRIEVDQYEP
jgi:hypothetical protein